MKGWLLTGDDFINKAPEVGNMILYYEFDKENGKRNARAGIIARNQDVFTWVIDNKPVYKIQFIFVLTTDAYLRYKSLTNPLAI